MAGYINSNHLITNSPMAFQEITSIVFNRHGEEWLCSLYADETYVACGREKSMDLALTQAIRARSAALSNAERNR